MTTKKPTEPMVRLGVWQSCEDRAQWWEDECDRAIELIWRLVHRPTPMAITDAIAFWREHR